MPKTLSGKLVAAFGHQVFEVIERTPQRLREIGGIGAKKLQRIIAGWADQNHVGGTDFIAEIIRQLAATPRRPDLAQGE